MFEAGSGRKKQEVKYMIRQLLLEIILGIEFEHGAHVRHWNHRQFSMTHQRIAHADGEHNLFGAAAQRLADRTEMFAQQLWREPLLIRRSILQSVTQKIQPFTFALQMDRLCGAST